MGQDLIQGLVFDDKGLIPAIIQDDETREVLMVAWMNAESLALTMRTGETWFWSRSRGELWHKGATSGNRQEVVDIRLDCDGDALLVRVKPQGPACHTGERTCFYRGASSSAVTSATVAEKPPVAAGSTLSVVNLPALELGIVLQELYLRIEDRRRNLESENSSYTAYLFREGLDKILKKVGEEAAETIIAAKNAGDPEGRRSLSSEISDLLYHLLVLLVERDVSLSDIAAVLTSRTGRPASAKYHQKG